MCFPFSLFSQKSDSLRTEKKEIPRLLEKPIPYNAKDSIRINIKEQKVYLFGKAVVKYGKIELKAGYIEYSLKDKSTCAYPRLDSSGKEVEFPEFTDGEQNFTAKKMCYNFESKKAYVEGSKTKQGEGFIHFDKVKVYASKETHGAHGKYTTCDLEHPHYYFNISKAVVKPNDKIVAGPLVLYIADVPTPIALPFGFFPNSKNKGKGVIIPTYVNNYSWGNGLVNGGYYIPFGEKADLQLTGSIYTRGTWGVRAISRYKNLYKYNGNLQLSFQQNFNGDKKLDTITNFSKSKAFSIIWKHNQDPKARPYSSFNVNIDYNSSAREDINKNDEGVFNNSYQSSISYRRVFPNTPFSINIKASQAGKYTYIDSEVNPNKKSFNNLTFNLPDINLAMNRIYPLAVLKKEKFRGEKWAKELSKIYITYNSQFRNTVSFIDTSINQDNYRLLINKMRNGFNHNVTTGTSLKILNKLVTINPSIRMTERWYLQTLNKRYDPTTDEVINDTLRGVSNWARSFDGSFNVSASSKIYGFYSFANFAKGKRSTIVRHAITPTVSFNFSPNFNSLTDTGFYNDSLVYSPYSPLQLGIYGYPPNSKSGLLNFSVVNSLEMKIKKKTDSGWVYNKVKLIDNFNISSSYDILKDSLKLGDIIANGRTKLFKNFSLYGSIRYNPYKRDTLGRLINKYLIKETGKIARFVNASLTFSFDISNKMFEKKETDTEKKEKKISEYGMPWNASFSYNLSANNYFYQSLQKDSVTYIQTARMNGQIEFTKNWRLGFNLTYDIQNKKLSYTTIDVYRDLHCWEMRISWIPFGPRQSYSFGINVKSTVLQDLKYEKRSQPKEFR